jgi:beta-phosphoglucomutase-like phosphatase (HAD superfamily)
MKFDDKIKALIFDCDGTLVDSWHPHMGAWLSAFKKYNCDLSHEYLNPFLLERNGIVAEKIIEELNQRHQTNLNIQSFLMDKEAIAYKALSHIQSIPSIAQILKENSSKYACIVFSGGNRKNVTKSLEVTDLKQYVHQIITSDDHYPLKNDPRAYQKIAALLGLQPEQCHFFEDGEMAIEAAKHAGMQVTAINKETLAKLDAAFS